MKRYTYCFQKKAEIISAYTEAGGTLKRKKEIVQGLWSSDKRNVSASYQAIWIYDNVEKRYLKNRFGATDPPEFKAQTLILWEICV